MTVILRDASNRKFQFTCERPASRGSALPVFTTQQKALDFLNNPQNSLTANDWFAICSEVKFTGPKKGVKAIKERLATELVSKKLYLIPAKSEMPAFITAQPGNITRGSTGQKSTAKDQSSVVEDDVSSVVEIEPLPAEEIPNNQTAEKLVRPGEVKPDDSDKKAPKQTTGAPSNKKTTRVNCPISMVSGEEMLSIEDLVLPGPLPFIWKRFYRTGHSRDSGLGHGWTHSGSEQLTLHDDTVVMADDEGRHLTFARPRLHQRSKLINEGLDLDYVAADCFILKQPGHGDKVFTRPKNSTGSHFRLSQLRDPAYQPAENNPVHIRNEQGFCIDFLYDAHNQLTHIKGNWGKSLTINRDANAHIISLALVNTAQKTRKTLADYDYDDQNDLIAHRNAAGQGERYQYHNHIITRRTLATGFSYYFEWDRLDNHARCLRNWGDNGIYDYHFQWDPDNDTSYATDSRGYTTRYIYNEFGHVTHETDPEGGIHTYHYENGRKTGYTNPQGHTTAYFYNADNQPTGERDALGNYHNGISWFQGRPSVTEDEDGNSWHREYFRREGLISTFTDPYGQKTHYHYHTASNLLRQIIDPQGHTSHYRWTEQGDLQQITDPQGNQQRFYYDDWGQLREHQQILSDETEARITRYTYTATGQAETITGPNGETSHYAYNDNQQLIRYSDPQGRLTCFDYDGLSQVIARTNPDGQTLQYHYDKERNLTRLTNENGEHMHFVYDGCERLIEETGFDGRRQHYEYNPAGELTRHHDNGIITDFERDALGQMVTRTSRDSHPTNNTTDSLPKERSRYRYDPKGRLLEVYNTHQLIEFEYDRLGNLEAEHHTDLTPSKDNKPHLVSTSKTSTRYETHWPGTRTGLVLPDGQRIDYGYTPQHQLAHIHFNDQPLTLLQRDAQGRETQRQQGQLTTCSDYDPMGRLSRQQATHQTGKQRPVHREYGYDAFNNLNRLSEGGHETRYVYDLLDRLKKTDGSLSGRFDFDPAGNIVSLSEQAEKTTHTTTRTAERKAKPANIHGNRLTLQGDRKFDYDSRGNLIRERRGKAGKRVTEYTWNLQNQLIRINREGQQTRYRYDPLGRRIEKRDAFGSTRYLWAEDQLVQEQRNTLKKTYIYEPHSFKPVALVQDGDIYHYHLDHLGTPRELTSEAGEIVWKVKYHTYGNVALKETEEIENNLRFQGQYFDEESGLHYNRHRYYSPHTGQFISQDPIGLLGGINSYQYAPNPTGWIDPLGLCKEPPVTNSGTKALGHLRIGHTTPWGEMTKAQRRAFQHSYSRHADELGLPKWKQGNAEELRTQFNNVVGHIRETGTHLGTRMKPVNSQSARVNYYESNLQDTKYYYYETMSGKFVSAGKAR